MRRHRRIRMPDNRLHDVKRDTRVRAKGNEGVPERMEAHLDRLARGFGLRVRAARLALRLDPRRLKYAPDAVIDGLFVRVEQFRQFGQDVSLSPRCRDFRQNRAQGGEHGYPNNRAVLRRLVRRPLNEPAHQIHRPPSQFHGVAKPQPRVDADGEQPPPLPFQRGDHAGQFLHRQFPARMGVAVQPCNAGPRVEAVQPRVGVENAPHLRKQRPIVIEGLRGGLRPDFPHERPCRLLVHVGKPVRRRAVLLHPRQKHAPSVFIDAVDVSGHGTPGERPVERLPCAGERDEQPTGLHALFRRTTRKGGGRFVKTCLCGVFRGVGVPSRFALRVVGRDEFRQSLLRLAFVGGAGGSAEQLPVNHPNGPVEPPVLLERPRPLGVTSRLPSLSPGRDRAGI